jgi:hypothetical protein
MSKRRTPTAILEAKGAFDKDPQRRRDAEPDTDLTLGGPPSRFTDFQKQLWRQISKRLLHGVAKRSDRDAFETLVLLKESERSGVLLPAERGQLLSLYGRFAMTPSDRSKVVVDNKPTDALDELLKKRRSQSSPQPTVN